MFDDFKSAGHLPAVNFHLWQACNMRCQFCFAPFQDVKEACLPKGHLPEAQAIEVVKRLCEFGLGKITFAGGEPMLCPWLPKLLSEAKKHGVTTMIVTNGTKLSEEWLAENGTLVDWIALSVDSTEASTNQRSGRNVRDLHVPDFGWYLQKAESIKASGIRYKVNTVVNRLNADEDLSPFIALTLPERWKIFQVLPVRGQNDGKVDELLIPPSVFDRFVARHREALPGISIVEESNDQMTGSYLMVDPAGRFYDNAKGEHTYSEEILKVGIESALESIRFDYSKFIDRGGQYEW